jgi:hypothetical protein
MSATDPDTTPIDPIGGLPAGHSPLALNLLNPPGSLSGALWFLWRASRGYRLRPWASPYLRWRIETYWGWPAEEIRFGRFWLFAWRQRRSLALFLRWAAANASQQHNRFHA